MVGLISEPAGSAAGQWEDVGSQVPSGVMDATPWLRDSSLLASSSGNAAATYGSYDDYGREITPPEAAMPKEAANAQYGIPGRLSFANDLPESVAQEMNTAKRAEMVREDAEQRRPGGFLAGAAGFATGTAAMLLDPVDAASLFIPVLPEARIAEAAAGAGLEGLAGRTVARVAAGAGSGAIQQGALSVPRYVLSQQEQADYGASDVLWDTLYGAALGGGMHGVLGLGREALGGADEVTQAFERTRLGQVMAADPAARAGVMKAALAAVVEDRPVDVEPLGDLYQAGEPATLADLERMTNAEGVAANPGASDLIDQIRGAGRMQPKNEQSLVSWLVAKGGIRDDSGDLAEIMGSNRARPGLISRYGVAPDIAANRARDEGFFPEHPNVAYRPDTMDATALYEAIGDELNQGVKRFGGSEDRQTRLLRDQADQLDRVLQEHGLSLESPKDEILAVLRDADPSWRESTVDAADGGAPDAAPVESWADGGAPDAAPVESWADGGADDVGTARDAAERIANSETVRQAAGGLPREMQATSDAADEAAARSPLHPGAVPPEIEAHIQDLTESLQRSDATGLLTAADHEAIAGANSWIEQARLFGQGALQAAACVARGLM